MIQKEISDAMVTITLPDGSKREYNQGATGADVALSIGAGLAYPVKDGIPVMLVDEARKLTLK